MNQKEAAYQDMSQWLAHPDELGKTPDAIENTREFYLHELKYYVFRFKRNADEPWLLGVAGGYEGDSLENSGHIFSRFERYEEDKAEEKAIEMVEMIREYWMKQARQAEERRSGQSKKAFVGFVLLANAEWNWEMFSQDLAEQWKVSFEEKAEDNTLIFEYDGFRSIVSLFHERIPNQEAEANAANNVQWPGAVEAAKAHTAHLLVSVSGTGSMIEKGKLFVELLAASSLQENVLGIYSSGTVFEPGYYEDAAYLIKRNTLPIYNWIHFGLYRTKNGLSGYTYGLKQFGFLELEVLNTFANPKELMDFLADLTYYVLDNNVTLHDGETIGFSAEQKLKISESDGIALEERTLKIEYPD